MPKSKHRRRKKSTNSWRTKHNKLRSDAIRAEINQVKKEQDETEK